MGPWGWLLSTIYDKFSVELNLVLYFSRRCWCKGGSAWPVVCRSYGASADLMVLVHEICISVCRVDCTLRMQDAPARAADCAQGSRNSKAQCSEAQISSLTLSPALPSFCILQGCYHLDTKVCLCINFNVASSPAVKVDASACKVCHLS